VKTNTTYCEELESETGQVSEIYLIHDFAAKAHSSQEKRGTCCLHWSIKNSCPLTGL